MKMKNLHNSTFRNDRKKYLLKSCEHKSRYATAADAKKAVATFYKRVVISIDPFTSYRCEIHGCFHVGHKRPADEVKAFNEMLREIQYYEAA